MADDGVPPLAKRVKYGGLESSKMTKPQAVLPDAYIRGNETVRVFVAEITDRTQASRLVRDLNSVFPMGELVHLRRIRTSKVNEDAVLQILLCQANSNHSHGMSLEELFKDKAVGLEGLGQMFETEVPLHQPLTRKQFQDASKLWPTTFHEDKHISRVISGDLFDDDSCKKCTEFMSVALCAALEAKSIGMLPVGAVVVDPQDDKVVAVGFDLSSKGHPLQHAVMVCIDLVAWGQMGGAWNLGCQKSNGIWKLSKECDCSEQRSSNVKPCVDRISEKTQMNEQYDRPGTVRNAELRRDEGRNLKARAGMSTHSSIDPYLCTGYDMYITREPCVMCAMALVHSRIRRVFYGCSNPSYGALGSRYKIHTLPKLNHHYEVFKGVMEKECRNAWT